MKSQHSGALVLLVAVCCVTAGPTLAQTRPSTIDWARIAESTLGRAVEREDVPGATVVITGPDATIFSTGFGVGNMNSQTPATNSTLFDVGSIGKTLTAIAVLQLAEQGHLDVSEDVNNYLDEWSIQPPNGKLVTLHHLLTHSSGLNDRAIGYASRTTSDVLPLRDHLRENLPDFFAQPGEFISYSNYGYGLAGLAAESASGMPFIDYVEREVLEPIGITDSGYRLPSGRSSAEGYIKRRDGIGAAPRAFRPVTPAGSFIANANDMGVLLRAILNDGGELLQPASANLMTSVQERMHPALMGNSYGLEESRWSDVRGFGKGGSVPGFAAYMAVLPEDGLAFFAATNSSSDEAIEAFVLEATSAVSAARDPGVGQSTVRATISRENTPFLGEYRSNRYDRSTVEKLLNFESHYVYDSDNGKIALWHDGQMNAYHPVDATLFQHETDPNRFVFFQLDENGNTTHAYSNQRFAGGYVPVVWEKNSFLASNAYVNEYFGVVLLAALSYLLWPAVAAAGVVIRRLRRRTQRSQAKKSSLNRVKTLIGFLTSALLFAYTLLYFIPLLRNRSELIFGIPDKLERFEALPVFFFAGFSAFAVAWTLSLGKPGRRYVSTIYGFVFILSGVLVAEFCLRWNLV